MTETRILNQSPQPTYAVTVAHRSIALLRAHNEAAGIAAALEAVQSRPGVDMVVVHHPEETAPCSRT